MTRDRKLFNRIFLNCKTYKEFQRVVPLIFSSVTCNVNDDSLHYKDYKNLGPFFFKKRWRPKDNCKNGSNVFSLFGKAYEIFAKGPHAALWTVLAGSTVLVWGKFNQEKSFKFKTLGRQQKLHSKLPSTTTHGTQTDTRVTRWQDNYWIFGYLKQW